MGKSELKSSILLSIFRRKGGEGHFTKIIDSGEIQGQEEQPLLSFRQDDSNWTTITNTRVFGENEGVKLSIPFVDLVDVLPAFKQEFKDRITNMNDFTRLALSIRNGDTCIIKVEKGAPYQGFLQVLHFAVSKSRIDGN